MLLIAWRVVVSSFLKIPVSDNDFSWDRPDLTNMAGKMAIIPCSSRCGFVGIAKTAESIVHVSPHFVYAVHISIQVTVFPFSLLKAPVKKCCYINYNNLKVQQLWLMIRVQL